MRRRWIQGTWGALVDVSLPMRRLVELVIFKMPCLVCQRLHFSFFHSNLWRAFDDGDVR